MLESLKAKVRFAGLLNRFLPDSEHEVGLTNLEYALYCGMMARISFAAEVVNCSAPDAGNVEAKMEVGK